MEPNQSCVDDDGSGEDRLGGSLGQSHHHSSQAKSQVAYSRHDETFEVGDEMILSMRNISMNQHQPSKLWRHWIGPYRVTKVIFPLAHGLDLPLAWWIHLVFHVLNLKRFHRSTEFEREERPPSPMVIDGEEEYEVGGDSRA